MLYLLYKLIYTNVCRSCKRLMQYTTNLGFEVSNWIKINKRNSDQEGVWP